MREEIYLLLKNARAGRLPQFHGQEKDLYQNWLDELLYDVPRLNQDEVDLICDFIRTSISHLTEICEGTRLKRSQYAGCMENLNFLVEYLMHHYAYKVGKTRLQGLLIQLKNPRHTTGEGLQRIRRYYRETRIEENIRFYLEYYYTE